MPLKGWGFSFNKWFLEKPDGFVINHSEFQNLIDKLETQGTIKRALNQQSNFYLSDKGKKELAALKKQLKFKEYILIITNFPVIELKERVKSLESFVLSSIILTVGSVIIFRLSQIFSYNITILSFLLFLFYVFVLIAAYYVGNNLGSILLFKINDMQRETLWIYKEWYWDNQYFVNRGIAVLFVIVSIVIGDYLQISTMINSFMLFFFGIICIWVYNIFTTQKPERQS